MEYDEFVITFVRKKLSRDVLPAENSKLVAVVEAFDESSRQIYKSANCTISTGTKIFVPWSDNLITTKISLYSVDGMITASLGTCWLTDIQDITSTVDVTADITHSQRRVGKLYLQLFSQIVYNKPLSTPTPKRSEEEELTELLKHTRPPGFRFQRLRQPLNWNRLRSLNIERVMESNDYTQVLSCAADVTQGDVAQEDVDPRLYHALQLAQYTSQYLVACQDMLQSHTKVITEAISVFEEEEETLDLQLAKMRSRQKALMRETTMVDEMTQDYTDLVAQINPGFAKKQQTRRKHRRRVSKAVSDTTGTSEEEDTIKYLRMIKNPPKEAWEIMSIPADRQENIAPPSSASQRLASTRPVVSTAWAAAAPVDKPPKQASSIEIKRKEIPPSQSQASDVKSTFGMTGGSLAMSVDSLAMRETQDLHIHHHDEAVKSIPEVEVCSDAPESSMRRNSFGSRHSTRSESITSVQSSKGSVYRVEDYASLARESSNVSEAEPSQILPVTLDVMEPDATCDTFSDARERSRNSDNQENVELSRASQGKESDYSDDGQNSDDLYDEDSPPRLTREENDEEDAVVSFRDMSLQESPILKSTTRRFEDHFPTASTRQRDESQIEHDDIFGPSVDMSRSQLFINENDDMLLESATMTSVDLSQHRNQSEDNILNLVRHEGVVKENTLATTAMMPRERNDDEDDMVLMGTKRIPQLQLTMSSELSYPATNESEDPDFSPGYIPTFSDRREEHTEEPAPATQTDNNNPIQWSLGRAHIDEVETGCALDIYVSGIRLDMSRFNVSKVMLQAEFLNAVSPPSTAINTSLHASVIPVNYAASIKFTRDVSVAVAEEIESQQEDLCIKLIVTDEDAQLLAEAVVNIWIMVEDEINIVLMEVDICSCESEEVVGSAVVDVRGRYALMKCNS